MTLTSMSSNLAGKCKSQWWTEVVQAPRTLEKKIKLSSQGLRYPTCRGNYERDDCSKKKSEKHTEMIKKTVLSGLRVFHTSTASKRIFLSGAHFPIKWPKTSCNSSFPTSDSSFMLSEEHIVPNRGASAPLNHPVCTHYHIPINKLCLGYIKLYDILLPWKVLPKTACK